MVVLGFTAGRTDVSAAFLRKLWHRAPIRIGIENGTIGIVTINTTLYTTVTTATWSVSPHGFYDLRHSVGLALIVIATRFGRRQRRQAA